MQTPWNVVPYRDETHVVGPNGESLVVRGAGAADAAFLAAWVAMALNRACGASDTPQSAVLEDLPPIVGYDIAVTAASPADSEGKLVPPLNIESSGMSGMPADAAVLEMTDEDARDRID